VGFIGYLYRREGSNEGANDEVVRIFLECREQVNEHGQAEYTPAEKPLSLSYTYAVDVVFPGGKPPCRLRGVDGILALKKFYKLVNSLEERAREHGNDREKALSSAAGLLEHLAYTRNARNFTGLEEPKPFPRL